MVAQFVRVWEIRPSKSVFSRPANANPQSNCKMNQNRHSEPQELLSTQPTSSGISKVLSQGFEGAESRYRLSHYLLSLRGKSPTDSRIEVPLCESKSSAYASNPFQN